MFYRETDFKDEPLIGEIPKDWESIKLEEVVEIHDSKRIPLSEMERKNRKGQYPYCGANGIIDYIDDYIFDGEFVLLAEDGGSYGRLENTAYIMNGKFWVNNHAHILRAIEGKTSNLFLKHALDFLDLNPYIVGSTRKKLNQEQMREIKIPFPPFEEQRAIVRVLGVVDSVIAKTGEVIAKTERLKKGLMQTLLTRGIGHKEYKQTPIGTTPKTWEVIPCSGLCKEITVGIVVTPAKYYADSGIPCLRSFNIEENEINPKNLAYISPEANELHTKSIIHTGDVVAVRTGQPGTASVVPPAFDGANCVDLIIFRLNEKMQPHFFSWFLNSFQAKKQISAGQTGSVQQHFNIRMAKKLKVPVPPLNEQEKIVTILNSIHKKLKLEQKEKSILESIKRGLMNLLLTGKIRAKVD